MENIKSIFISTLQGTSVKNKVHLKKAFPKAWFFPGILFSIFFTLSGISPVWATGQARIPCANYMEEVNKACQGNSLMDIFTHLVPVNEKGTGAEIAQHHEKLQETKVSLKSTMLECESVARNCIDRCSQEREENIKKAQKAATLPNGQAAAEQFMKESQKNSHQAQSCNQKSKNEIKEITMTLVKVFSAITVAQNILKKLGLWEKIVKGENNDPKGITEKDECPPTDLTCQEFKKSPLLRDKGSTHTGLNPSIGKQNLGTKQAGVLQKLGETEESNRPGSGSNGFGGGGFRGGSSMGGMGRIGLGGGESRGSNTKSVTGNKKSGDLFYQAGESSGGAGTGGGFTSGGGGGHSPSRARPPWSQTDRPQLPNIGHILKRNQPNRSPSRNISSVKGTALQDIWKSLNDEAKRVKSTFIRAPR